MQAVSANTSMGASNPLLSTAMKRLSREAAEMQEADEYMHAQPIEENLFEWHFTIRGQRDTDFAEGIYHGRLIFPSNYPLHPPEIFMLTPNGVFETDKKICLSMSSYHPETWLPSWSIRTGLLALIGFMPNCPEGVLGHIKRSSEERRFLASQSVHYHCPTCFTKNGDILKQPVLPMSAESACKSTDIAAGGAVSSADCAGEIRPSSLASADPVDGVTGSLLISREDLPSSVTLSSLLTSTLAFVFVFLLMRKIYVWTNPPLDF